MSPEQWVLIGAGVLAYTVATPFFLMRYFVRKIADGELIPKPQHELIVDMLKQALARSEKVEDESLETIGDGVDSMLLNQIEFQANLNRHLEARQ